MGRLERIFESKRSSGGDASRASREKVLVAYLCVGDPSVEESVDLAVTAAEAGADILELGVPFSDPTADGATIARASERALARGGGLRATLAACKAVRARSSVPIVLFGYYNPIFVRGVERVVGEAKDAGVDGLLVVDLPVDASGPLRRVADASGLCVVPLLAPTSSAARVDAVRTAGESGRSGFLYYVSLTGVTGAASTSLEEASRAAEKLGVATGLPTVVGFGIDTPEKARQASLYADGVVVGTAIVRRIEEGTSPEARKESVRSLVTSFAQALASPAPLMQ
jgi:tryptophan synthase alpha chain